MRPLSHPRDERAPVGTQRVRAVEPGLRLQPGCLLNGRNILPSLVVAFSVSMIQPIENAEFRLPSSIQDLQHMRNTIASFCNSLQAIPYFASLGNEIVIWVDQQKCGDLFVELQICHAFPPMRSLNRKSGLLHASICRHSGLFCRCGECRRIFPDELLHAQRTLSR